MTIPSATDGELQDTPHDDEDEDGDRDRDADHGEPAGGGLSVAQGASSGFGRPFRAYGAPRSEAGRPYPLVSMPSAWTTPKVDSPRFANSRAPSLSPISLHRSAISSTLGTWSNTAPVPSTIAMRE